MWYHTAQLHCLPVPSAPASPAAPGNHGSFPAPTVRPLLGPVSRSGGRAIGVWPFQTASSTQCHALQAPPSIYNSTGHFPHCATLFCATLFCATLRCVERRANAVCTPTEGQLGCLQIRGIMNPVDSCVGLVRTQVFNFHFSLQLLAPPRFNSSFMCSLAL